MAWPEISIEDFPPERDDEPSSLRQDIIDELSDHFACALNRELLKNSDEQLACQRVLNQFGDPIKIARQLWFDAMKEKIMSQKIMTGVSIVMAICCITVVGIAWTLMKESQGVNQSMLAQLAAIADRPQPVDTANIDQKILNQLEQLNQKQMVQAVPTSEEMNQVSVQLVQDNNAKKPTVGFTGKLTKSGNQTDQFTVEAVSDESGKLDFGKLPWGEYQLNLISPWEESSIHENLIVIPGRSYSQTIVCPAAAPKPVPVQFQVNWPDSLKSEDWLLLCDFRDRSYGGVEIVIPRKIGNEYWIGSQKLYVTGDQLPVYLIDKNNQVSLCPLDQKGEFKDLDPDTLVEKPSINIVEKSNYFLAVIYLIPKNDLKNLSVLNSPKSYKIIVIENNKARTIAFNPMKNIPQLAGVGGTGKGNIKNRHYISSTSILLPFKKITSTPVIDDSVLSGLPSLTKTTNGVLLPKKLSYSASEDHPNVWEIKLPDLNSIPVESDSLNKTK